MKIKKKRKVATTQEWEYSGYLSIYNHTPPGVQHIIYTQEFNVQNNRTKKSKKKCDVRIFLNYRVLEIPVLTFWEFVEELHPVVLGK
jgi:hypothetical protein